jgi:polyadenylate-binding protein
MKDNSNGRSKGFGFVCYMTPDEAGKAVNEMSGKLLSSKPIYVAFAQRKEVRRAQLEAQFSHSNMFGPRMPMGAMHPGMYGMGMMPYMMTPQQGPVPPRGGYPMTPQMMPMGTPRGAPLTPYQGRATYPVPTYAITPTPLPAQQQIRRPGPSTNGLNRTSRVMPPGSILPQGVPAGSAMNGRARFPQGVVPPLQSQSMMSNQAQLSANYKLTQQARNPSGHMPGMMPRSSSVIPSPIQPLSLTAQALAAASPEVQKNMIGERLYPLIHSINSDFAGKVTGMLLEMDNSELLHLLESPDSLKSKVHEALQVLQAHVIDA